MPRQGLQAANFAGRRSFEQAVRAPIVGDSRCGMVRHAMTNPYDAPANESARAPVTPSPAGHSSVVVGLGILHIVFGVLFSFVGLLQIVGALLAANDTAIGSIAMTTVVCGSMIAVGIGLKSLAHWARVVAIVFASLAILAFSATLVTAIVSTGLEDLPWLAGVFGNVLFLVFPVATVIILARTRAFGS
jgi:hypothetical protein